MRVIILSFILFLCSCCPVDNSNSTQKKKNNEIVINCSKYRIRNTYGRLANLYEFELHGHIFLLNINNDYKLIHAPYCPCKQTQSTTTESIFKSNSYF